MVMTRCIKRSHLPQSPSIQSYNASYWLVLFIASVLVVTVLDAAGIEALAPAAGTVAASWQASLGLVEEGSLFAWCQSAATGGAAVGGI